MSEIIHLLILLIGAHFLCDFPLQGNYLAIAKNRHEYIDIPFPEDTPFEDKYDGMCELKWKEWKWALGGHAFIHGGAVYLITGLWYLAAIELVFHALIDDKKCGGKLTYNQDQFLHIGLKVLYVIVILIFGGA